MMVTDRKGRLVHVSRDLAEALGRTPSALLEDMGANASVWDSLLPEPFAQLHRGEQGLVTVSIGEVRNKEAAKHKGRKEARKKGTPCPCGQSQGSQW